jgi:hypothetical protein
MCHCHNSLRGAGVEVILLLASAVAEGSGVWLQLVMVQLLTGCLLRRSNSKRGNNCPP